MRMVESMSATSRRQVRERFLTHRDKTFFHIKQVVLEWKSHRSDPLRSVWSCESSYISSEIWLQILVRTTIRNTIFSPLPSLREKGKENSEFKWEEIAWVSHAKQIKASRRKHCQANRHPVSAAATIVKTWRWWGYRDADSLVSGSYWQFPSCRWFS